LNEKPGCYFFLGCRKVDDTKTYINHEKGYDFNDDLIGSAIYFWVKLVEDRLSVKLI
jgi:metal-dependent amidase/aminoacylase/carboxypeptidase family protein